MGVKPLVPAAILVLGRGAPPSVLSMTFAARLESALASARAAEAMVVVSGGRNSRTASQADIMAAHLQGGGLPPERILRESASTSTFESLVFSARLLIEAGISMNSHIQLITSDCHKLRADLIARRVGFTDVSSIGVATPQQVRLRARLRECGAMLCSWLLGEI